MNHPFITGRTQNSAMSLNSCTSGSSETEQALPTHSNTAALG